MYACVKAGLVPVFENISNCLATLDGRLIVGDGDALSSMFESSRGSGGKRPSQSASRNSQSETRVIDLLQDMVSVGLTPGHVGE